MRFYIKHILLSVVMMAMLITGATAAAPTAEAAVPGTIAESACMIDVDTGKVLYQVNPTKWSIRQVRRKSLRS